MNRAYSVLTLRAVADADGRRTFSGIASTPSTDRMGDVVEPKGAQFKLPIPLLWQHDSRQPIGWVTGAKVTDAGIEVEGEVAVIAEPGGLQDRVNDAWQMLKAKLVRGLSIGFNSIESARIDGTYGLRFLKWEWLELSAVTIAANQDASISVIRAADQALIKRAATGADEGGSGGAKPTPGVAGKQSSKPNSRNAMKTYAEQIADFSAQRKAAADEQSAMMTKSSEEGRTLDAQEAERHDELEIQIEQLDKHIERLRRADKQNTAAAAAVPAAAATSAAAGLEARSGGAILSVRRNLPKGTAFTRYALAILKARGSRMEAAQIAEQLGWGRDTPEVVTSLKTAVAAASTTDSAWAGSLVEYQTIAAEFIELLRPRTILGRIPGFRNVPFNIRVQRQTAGVTGGFVGEGAPKPVNKMAFDSVTMAWAKAAVIVVMTDEVIRFSNPQIEALAREDMLNGISVYLDKRFIDPSFAGVANVSPASITNGITPRESSGASYAAILADISAMEKAYAVAELNFDAATWVMSPSTAISLSKIRTTQDEIAFPGISAQGGTFDGLPVVTSNSVATSGSPSEGMIVLLDASEIFMADEGGITVDMSTEASLQMDDAPSAGAAQLVSLYQNNLVALRAERYINWMRRRDAAVQVLGNVNY